MPLELLAAFSILIALTFYVLMGGADYGGGVWDLFAFGTNKDKQRQLIAEAIGPIWEANHVWIILVIVILFTGFPKAFAAVSIACHIPLTLMLIGIVLRGSAFTFRTYDKQEDLRQRLWGRVFAIASLITPITLGIIVGAISTERIHRDYIVDFISPWLSPFTIAIGFMTLALFAFIAAVYLSVEAFEKNDYTLATIFKKRAIISQCFLALSAFTVFMLSKSAAIALWHKLANSHWTIPLQLVVAVLAIASIVFLLKNQYRLARLFAVAQVTLILWGWAFAQFPFLVRPEITIFNAGSSETTLMYLLIALGLGALILFPSFCYLYIIFKNNNQVN
jgi:cytochrome d ubiquinol oxidase subunit II